MIWPDSPASGTLGDGLHATATDRPSSVDELCETVRRRVAEGHAIFPQGGCTALDYGGTPRCPGVAIDTSGLNRVIDYPAADMTVTVEAGITFETLRDVLVAEGQRLLIDIPFPDRATLGGAFATNSCGPRRFGLGRPRDQILGVSFVTSEGAVVKGGGRVVKNVAGYDFPRLLTGSMGTLGILSQMTLKVRPGPEASAILWASYDGPEPIAAALDRLNTSATRPVMVEVLNPSAALRIGEAMGVVASRWALVVGFEDNASSVAWQVDRLGNELDQAEIRHIDGAEAIPLWSSLCQFQAIEAGPITIVANVRPSSVMRFAGRLTPDRWAVQAHAGNGLVRAHRLGDVEETAIAAEIQALRAEAVRDGGNVTLSRCPVGWKASLKVWGEPRPDWALCKRIKGAFDPKGMMNPGRFVGTI